MVKNTVKSITNNFTAISIIVISLLTVVLCVVMVLVGSNATESTESEAPQDEIIYDSDDEELEYDAVVSEEWLRDNLYQVLYYKETDDGDYKVKYLVTEEPSENSFDELIDTFKNTPYSVTNNEKLKDGVNCQGMTVYMAKWCRKQNKPFKILYFTNHVEIQIKNEGTWYTFNFSGNSEIKKNNMEDD